MAAAKTLAVILVISLTLAVRCTAGASVTRLADFPNFTEVPLIRQGTVYSCGIACLHSLLRWISYELDTNDENLMEYCGTTKGNGTPYEKMLQYMSETGNLRARWQEGMTAAELKAVIKSGGVVMMPIQAWEYKAAPDEAMVPFTAADYRDYWQGGHWVIACGCSDQKVLFMDPATAGCYAQMSWQDLMIRWHDSPDYVGGSVSFKKYEHAGIVVYRTGGEGYDRQAVMPLN